MTGVASAAASLTAVRLRATTWLLATGGVFLGHILGYTVAHPDRADRALALSGHAYFGPVAAVFVPVAAVAVLAIGIRTVRQLGDVPTFAELAVAQAGLFLFQELLERVPGAGGPLDAFAEPGVWAGLLAQIAVAWIAIRAVRATASVVRAVTSGERPTASAAPFLLVATVDAVAPCRAVAVSLPGRRGPPLPVAAALVL